MPPPPFPMWYHGIVVIAELSGKENNTIIDKAVEHTNIQFVCQSSTFIGCDHFKTMIPLNLKIKWNKRGDSSSLRIDFQKLFRIGIQLELDLSIRTNVEVCRNQSCHEFTLRPLFGNVRPKGRRVEFRRIVVRIQNGNCKQSG